MSTTDPVAFLSYVRSDDEHDRGRITALRHRLEGEVRMYTGQPFRIFQDKKDIEWGQQWRKRLDDTLLSVTFLIPIITPSYFFSAACRDEFTKFLLREKQIGENRLILPIYYLEADQISNTSSQQVDEIAETISSRNWADWRQLRFKDIQSAEVEATVAEMAKTIKRAMKELESIIAASDAQPTSSPVAVATEPPDHFKFELVIPEQTKVVRSALRSRKQPYQYTTYTKDFDEIVDAEDLIEIEAQTKIITNLNRRVRTIKKTYSEHIKSISSKRFDINKLKYTDFTFLLDNSGSMRGEKIANTAAFAYVLSDILEKIGMKSEVLGFTTRAWKGGQSRERWLSEGKPKLPGRLNDLRHIIYKKAEVKTSEVIHNFSLMLREGILKENIDGEALIWARERIIERNPLRPILIVMSDGAPVDDSTLSVNPATILVNHLRDTIKWISGEAKIEIVGVGVEYDCSIYYPKSIFLEHTTEMGEGLLAALNEWLN